MANRRGTVHPWEMIGNTVFVHPDPNDLVFEAVTDFERDVAGIAECFRDGAAATGASQKKSIGTDIICCTDPFK